MGLPTCSFGMRPRPSARVPPMHQHQGHHGLSGARGTPARRSGEPHHEDPHSPWAARAPDPHGHQEPARHTPRTPQRLRRLLTREVKSAAPAQAESPHRETHACVPGPSPPPKRAPEGPERAAAPWVRHRASGLRPARGKASPAPRGRRARDPRTRITGSSPPVQRPFPRDPRSHPSARPPARPPARQRRSRPPLAGTRDARAPPGGHSVT